MSNAARFSGLNAKSRPKFSLKLSISRKYSGCLTLATVNFAPNFFARTQLKIFTSSCEVQAIKKSAVSTPASISTSLCKQPPTKPCTSNLFTFSLTTSMSESTTVTSCPSSSKFFTSVSPTFPTPTIINFIPFILPLRL